MLSSAREDAIFKLASKTLAERAGEAAFSAQAIPQSLADRLHAPFAHMASLPFKAVGGAIGTFLFGGKALAGPMKGRRLEAIPGGPGVGMSQVQRHEFDAIKAGKVPGRAYAGALEGSPIFFKRNYRPGGLVGLMHKHPGKAALAGAGLLYLLNNRDKAAPTYELAKGFVPLGAAPSSSFSPETVASFAQQSTVDNPLQNNSWGSR